MVTFWLISTSVGTPTPKVGVHLGVWGSFPPTLLHSQEHEMWLLGSFLARTFASPCLYREPKVRVATHCNWFCHVGYDKGPCPTPYYIDKHEQVKFILNTLDFKVPIHYYFQSAFFQFLVLCTCIEIKVFFQFCFNPPSLSNLIMSSQVWCMTPASKTSRWFHWSNSRMSSFLMSSRDVKTCPKRCGILWQKTICFYYMYKVRFFHLNLSII